MFHFCFPRLLNLAFNIGYLLLKLLFLNAAIAFARRNTFPSGAGPLTGSDFE